MEAPSGMLQLLNTKRRTSTKHRINTQRGRISTQHCRISTQRCRISTQYRERLGGVQRDEGLATDSYNVNNDEDNDS
jgi:hypothetical protein